MTDTPDADLLEQFARENSGPAFAMLVERHISLVHSVALRHTSSPQHAQDITQAVFIILARKAATLNRKIILPGWLYHTARLTAANFQRAEIRRVQREQEAYMQSMLQEPAPEAPWSEMSPLLDEAMARLGTTDRDALVLRYFQNKSLAEVGLAMGLEERTAQKRVLRAIEKLRKIFAQRGVTLTATAIAGAVSANSVQAAPATLAKTISAIAVAKGAAATTSTLTLVKGALKIMTYAKFKLAMSITAAILLAGGTVTIVLSQNAGGQRNELSIDEKVAGLNKPGTTVDEVIAVLGEPQRFGFGTNIFNQASLPNRYTMTYTNGVDVSILLGKVDALRSLKPGPGFHYRNLHLNSSLDEVLLEVGRPAKTLVGENMSWLANSQKPNTSIPDVLYEDLNGIKGFGYYRLPQQNLQFFFRNDRVIALIIDVPQ